MCEADPRCQAFLAKAWPGVPIWPDVRTFDVGEPIGHGRGSRESSSKAAGHGRSTQSTIGGSVADATNGRRQDCAPGARRDESGTGSGECGVESGNRSVANTGRIGSGQDEPRRGQGERATIGWSSEGVWLVTAGVPCQPASRAGKQRGASDDRWLWPAAVSVFAAVRPAWGLFENPPGIGDVGLAGILSNLEAQGYAGRVFSLGACALGAPHRRMRYWIVCKRIGLADSSQPGCEGRDTKPGAQRLHPEHSQGELADSPQRGQRERGSAQGNAGHADERGQGGVGDTERISNGRRGRSAVEASRAFSGDNRSMPWGNYVWLPCSDGKIRRAPDSAVELVDGHPVDIIETLAKEGWPHRSIIGALGNSIIPHIAQMIISAMIKSEG